jgi:hypothetical protein
VSNTWKMEVQWTDSMQIWLRFVHWTFFSQPQNSSRLKPFNIKQRTKTQGKWQQAAPKSVLIPICLGCDKQMDTNYLNEGVNVICRQIKP